MCVPRIPGNARHVSRSCGSCLRGVYLDIVRTMDNNHVGCWGFAGGDGARARGVFPIPDDAVDGRAGNRITNLSRIVWAFSGGGGG